MCLYRKVRFDCDRYGPHHNEICLVAFCSDVLAQLSRIYHEPHGIPFDDRNCEPVRDYNVFGSEYKQGLCTKCTTEEQERQKMQQQEIQKREQEWQRKQARSGWRPMEGRRGWWT